jgi:geranylgeranyl diphosphate synthase, type II
VTAFDLHAFLAAEGARVQAALERAIALPAAPASLADAVRYAVRGGGKRVRPILCVAAYRALRPDVPDAAYDLAASLELIHTYSLIHDDLPSMDDDEVRRGRPSTHVAHGVATATLAGAAMIPLAVGVAAQAARDLDLDAGRRQRILQALCAAAGAGGMVGGQVMDLMAEGRTLELDELEAIHRRKTGALLGVAPLMGGLAAGGTGAALDALEVYGSAVGLAFQIADDILDVTGTTAVLGKTAGRDGELEKATFAALAGVEAARARAGVEVDTALAALDAAGIWSDELVALARFAAERDR